MNSIKILGAYGGKDKNRSTTSLLITDKVAIDAGNILNYMGMSASAIDRIFLTHSHFDHIADIAFMMDIFFAVRTTPLKIYAIKHTLDMLDKHIFNDTIWPDFRKIHLINSHHKAIEYIEITPDQTIEIDGVKFTPFETVHTVPSVGYVIEKNDSKILFTSDTYKCPKIWEIINSDKSIKSMIIEVSFPSNLDELANASLHLTPKLLKEELENLKRDDVVIYINHIKPEMYNIIKDELMQDEKTSSVILLDDGDEIIF